MVRPAETDTQTVAAQDEGTVDETPELVRCPHLGLTWDREYSALTPARDHRCALSHTAIDLGYQGMTCMTAAYVACPVYQNPPAKGAKKKPAASKAPTVVEEPAPESPVEQPAQWSPRVAVGALPAPELTTTDPIDPVTDGVTEPDEDDTAEGPVAVLAEELPVEPAAEEEPEVVAEPGALQAGQPIAALVNGAVPGQVAIEEPEVTGEPELQPAVAADNAKPKFGEGIPGMIWLMPVFGFAAGFLLSML